MNDLHYIYGRLAVSNNYFEHFGSYGLGLLDKKFIKSEATKI